MSEFLQIMTTTDTKEAAIKIAQQLVEQKIVACVQVSGPITSIYRWKGNIENTEEWYCTIKTRKSLYYQVEESIKAIHSYEVPEIIALPILEGSRAYLDWIIDVTKG